MCLFLISEALIAIIAFVVGKVVLNLIIPWWGVIFSPIWFYFASFLPGGFIITNAIFAIFSIMRVPWWSWVLSVLTSLLFRGIRRIFMDDDLWSGIIV